MNKKALKIPKFKNDAEAARFWDTHDSTKYLSQTKPVHLAFPRPKHKVVVGLSDREWRTLIRLACSRRMPYTNLLERLISKNLSAV